MCWAAVAAAAILVPGPGRAACPGDCDGNGTVTIDELVTLVDIALDGTGTERCPAGDINGNGAITIDELIAAVSAALVGCPPTPTPTVASVTPTAAITPSSTPSDSVTSTPVHSATPTATASGSATVSEEPTATVTAEPTMTGTPGATVSASVTVTSTATSPAGSATVTPTRTASPNASPSRTPTPEPQPSTTVTATAPPSVTPTQSPADSPTDTPVTTPSGTSSTPTTTATVTATGPATHTTTATEAPTSSGTPTPSRTHTAAASHTVTATRSHSPTATVPFTVTGSPTRSGTPTRTASRTATASATAPVPATATATRTRTLTQTRTATRTPSRTATQSPSVTPTPGLGLRHFSLNPASSSLRVLPELATFSGFSGSLDLAAGVPDPVTGIASVDIVGASEFLSVPIGNLTFCIKPIVPVSSAGVLACIGGVDLGVNSSQDHRIGVVGMNGFTADDCTDAGGIVESALEPHPGVCNGPVEIIASPEPDSGIGALLIAPDARFGTQGLPAEVTIDEGPCAQHGPGDPTVFGFVSGLSRAAILDANDVSGAVLTHDEHGENFSCPLWMHENGPGRLVLSVPAVHGATNGDAITVFVLDD